MSTHTQDAHWDYTIAEWNGEYYRKCLDIIFKNNDIHIICDIGANTGATTSIFLEYMANPNCKIYCFEPETHNMNFLMKKLEKHIHDGIVIPIQKGIYYGKTQARLYGMGHTSLNEIHHNVGGIGVQEAIEELVSIRNSRGEDVFCGAMEGMDKLAEFDTLEHLCAHTPDFIKIDVEGAEKNILIHSSLVHEAKYLLVEWHRSEPIDKYLPNHEIIANMGDILLRKTNVSVKD